MNIISKSLKYILGLILSMSIAMIIIGRSYSFDYFYDQGKICDVFGLQLEEEGLELRFLDGEKNWTVTADYGEKWIILYQNKWNYIVLDVLALNVPKFTTEIFFYNEAGEEVAKKEVTLTQGENIIPVEKQKFSSMKMCFNQMEGTKFWFKSVQAREKLSRFTYGKFICYTVLCFLFYLVITYFLSKIIQKKFGRRGNKSFYFVDLYLDTQDIIYRHMQKRLCHFSPNIKSCFRICLFLVIILYTTVTLNVNKVVKWYSFAAMLHVVVMGLLAWLLVEKEPVERKQNKFMWEIFLLYWVIVCISDLLVGKKFPYVGYVFLIIFGYFYYTVGKMKNPEQLIREMVSAMQISFIVVILFSMAYRPIVGVERYGSCFANPNSFANYLVPVIAAWFVSVELYMKKKKTGWLGVWLSLLYGIEGIILLFFLWKTQSRGAILAAFLVGAIFVYRQWKLRIKLIQVRYAVRIVAVMILLFVPVTSMVEWGLCTVPYMVQGEKTSGEKDMALYRGTASKGAFTTTVSAEVLTNSRIKASFHFVSLDTFTSSRLTYWRAYLRQMNFFGHEHKARVNDSNLAAHNMVLETSHRYGVIAVSFYIVLWAGVIYGALKMIKKKGESCFAITGWCIGYVALSMLDALEQPWIYIAWFLAYTVMGFLMIDNENDEEKKLDESD